MAFGRGAGFRTVESLGAWLHHAGCGTINADILAGRETPEQVPQGLSMLDEAYEVLKEKWAAVALPETFGELRPEHLRMMEECSGSVNGDFVSPPEINSSGVEIL